MEAEKQPLSEHFLSTLALLGNLSRHVPPNQLVINGNDSDAFEAYKSSTPSLWAAKQMQVASLQIRPGQRIRFLYTLGVVIKFSYNL
jgi:hypothetical protein